MSPFRVSLRFIGALLCLAFAASPAFAADKPAGKPVYCIAAAAPQVTTCAAYCGAGEMAPLTAGFEACPAGGSQEKCKGSDAPPSGSHKCLCCPEGTKLGSKQGTYQ
jgi:hypothetical protein